MADRKQVGFRASPALHAKLKAESDRTGVPIQRIVERLVEEHFRKKKRGT